MVLAQGRALGSNVIWGVRSTLAYAVCAFAKVQYEYYPNGLQRIERNEQAPWSGGGAWHVYADTVSVDVAGRRTSIAYPTALGGGQAWYGYAANGDLSTVTAFGQSTTYIVSN